MPSKYPIIVFGSDLKEEDKKYLFTHEFAHWGSKCTYGDYDYEHERILVWFWADVVGTREVQRNNNGN